MEYEEFLMNHFFLKYNLLRWKLPPNRGNETQQQWVYFGYGIFGLGNEREGWSV
jgi:hypothetical protein